MEKTLSRGRRHPHAGKVVMEDGTWYSSAYREDDLQYESESCELDQDFKHREPKPKFKELILKKEGLEILKDIVKRQK